LRLRSGGRRYGSWRGSGNGWFGSWDWRLDHLGGLRRFDGGEGGGVQPEDFAEWDLDFAVADDEKERDEEGVDDGDQREVDAELAVGARHATEKSLYSNLREQRRVSG
jgi:hypothetical protein